MRKNKKKLPTGTILLGIAASLLVLLLIGVGSFFAVIYGRIYPGVSVQDYSLGGMTKAEAVDVIAMGYKLPEQIQYEIVSGDIRMTKEYPLNSMGISIDYESTIDSAYDIGRSSTFLDSVQDILKAMTQGVRLPISLSYEGESLDAFFTSIASDLSNPATPAQILTENTVEVIQGTPGYEISATQLKESTLRILSEGKNQISITTPYIDTTLTDQELEEAKARVTTLLKTSLILEYERQSVVFDGEKLTPAINPRGDYDREGLLSLVESVKNSINRAPKNPVFTAVDGKVEEFSPALPGIQVKEAETLSLIKDSLRELETGEVDELVIQIPVGTTSPEFQTEDTNDLGIRELIGVGTSEYRGSISSRVHNIALAASRLNGVLIPPGEVFSFNETLGDISVYSGYKQSYVIRDGATVLGDGGGVCQVSTTLFRAALDAGLPIVERNPHSYRVTYYEQDSKPGLDATIYSPSVDLKIKNDTPGHILIQTLTDTDKYHLTFEFYGTDDGRISVVSEPVIHSSTPPPEDLYIDDPSLPAGTIKQIDYKAWGARVSFKYLVTKGQETLQDKTFYSNYRAWQAKFLRGTGPVQ